MSMSVLDPAQIHLQEKKLPGWSWFRAQGAGLNGQTLRIQDLRRPHGPDDRFATTR
jgi:hypothetical protein